MIQNIIQIEEEFWNGHIEQHIMPEADGSDATEIFLREQFKESQPEMTVPLIGFDEKLKRREEIAELMAKLETEKKKIEQEVKTYMKEAEIAENDNFFVSWKNTITNRIDSKRLKMEMPDEYEQFCKPSQSRRFVIKTVG